MATHIKIVSVLFIVFGILGVIAACFSSLVLGVLATFVGNSGEQGAALGGSILGLAGVMLTVFLLVVSIPGIICGWGLLNLRPWSRVLGIVLAAVSLIRFPIGTVFGIYALWVLFNKETEALLTARTQTLEPR